MSANPADILRFDPQKSHRRPVYAFLHRSAIILLSGRNRTAELTVFLVHAAQLLCASAAHDKLRRVYDPYIMVQSAVTLGFTHIHHS